MATAREGENGTRVVLNGYPSKIALAASGKSYEITYWYGGKVSGSLFVGFSEVSKLRAVLERAVNTAYEFHDELVLNPEAASVYIQPKQETLEDLAEAVHTATKRFNDAAAAEYPEWGLDTETEFG